MSWMSARPSSAQLATAGLYGLAGALLGAALSTPWLALAAWLAIAAYTVALARTRSSLAAAAAVVLAHGLTCMIAFPWMWDGNFLMFEYPMAEMVALRFGEAMILAVPYAIAVGVGHAMFHRRLAARLWVPLAWAGGEVLSYATSNACVDDWLNTQWTVLPVLRALALVGWWPLVLACLFAAASIGEALATRRWRLAIPSAVILVAIGLAPPIADGKAERLAGIAAIHTTSTVALPHVLPDGVDLLVWPESAIELRPLLAEGPGNGVVLPPLLPGTTAEHLIGLVTSLPGGVRQNQVLAVAADGRVLASRAKQSFLPLAEREFLGLGRTPYRSGRVRSPLAVAGRSIVALICGEGLSRELLGDGSTPSARLTSAHAGRPGRRARGRLNEAAIDVAYDGARRRSGMIATPRPAPRARHVGTPSQACSAFLSEGPVFTMSRSQYSLERRVDPSLHERRAHGRTPALDGVSARRYA